MAELLEKVVGSGSGASMDDGDNNHGTLLPEPEVERNETFLPHYDEHLRPGINRTSLEPNNKNNSRNNNNNMMAEVVEVVADQLTATFQVSNVSHILEMQEGIDGHVIIDMPPHEQVTARLPLAPLHLSKAIWMISLLTLVLDIRAALYKPASGVVFSHNKIAYYLALSAIFASGLGEATTAFWLSRQDGGSQHHLSFGRAVMCASFLPFVTILSISGYRLIED